jgi:ribosome maturation factor RimP
MITEKQVETIAVQYFADGPHFLVDVAIKAGNRIALFIDGDQGVTIEDCRAFSRFIEENLDRDTEDYDLTVSSAGADRPLKLPRQYRKNIGRDLELVLNDGRKFTGTLLAAGDTGITLKMPVTKKGKTETGGENIVITFNEIKTAKEVITFKK